jgi:hypothetical protein
MTRPLKLANLKRASKKADKTREFRQEVLKLADANLIENIQPLVDAMVKLAIGGYLEETETWQPCELVQIEDVARDENGNLLRSRTGDAIRIKVEAYPELDKGTMVLTSRKRSVAAPDRTALTDLLNRSLGKAREAEQTKAPREKLPEFMEAMLARAYGAEPEETIEIHETATG